MNDKAVQVSVDPAQCVEVKTAAERLYAKLLKAGFTADCESILLLGNLLRGCGVNVDAIRDKFNSDKT